MTSRKINCKSCKTYLGEIRDAKLKKGISYLCRSCENKRKIAFSRSHMKGADKHDIPDFMKGLFR